MMEMDIRTEPTKLESSSKGYRWALVGCICMLVLSACANPQKKWQLIPGSADDLMIVDCLLPPQIRQLGTKMVFLSSRRPVKISASECGIRGGEYVAFDRADAGTSLRVWLPQAETGDPQAQTYVGEIFEKGLGITADYQVAAQWYLKAAEQGYSRAQINLGYLYESGLGVKQDLTKAMNLYRQASGIEDGTLEYVSTLEFAKRESAKRDADKLKSIVSELTQQLADSEARYRNVQAQVQTERANLKELAEKTEAKRQELAASYRSNEPSKTPESVKALIELDVVRDELAAETSKNADLNQQLQDSRAKIVTLKTGLVADNQQIEKLKKQLTEQVDIVTSLEAALAESSNEPNLNKTREALTSAKSDAEITQQGVSDLRQRNNEVSVALLKELGEAEQRELQLKSLLAQRAESISELQERQVSLKKQYQQSIYNLHSELDLSSKAQKRVALQYAESETANKTIQAENRQLRTRLREQNAEVANREQEQQRLSAKVAALALSEQTSQAEKRAAEAATRVANAELALARLEQSRLVTKLVEAQLTVSNQLTAATPNTVKQLAVMEKQLANQQGIVDNHQLQAAELEQNITKSQAQTEQLPAEDVTQVVPVGPTIEIIEPPVLITRGPGEIITSADGTIDLVGRVSPADNLLTFAINGQRQSVNEAGIFNYRSNQVLDSIELTAVDDAGERASVTFSVAQRYEGVATNTVTSLSPAVTDQYPDIDFGRYHAIIIGNNQYDELSNLRTAETDARVVDKLLREQYGFTTQLLINASKLDILSAMSSAKEMLTEKDNLIVYYAGHGQIDPNGDRGYWLPVDATVDNTDQWISNAVVTNYLDSISAKQIMVVADSCFSGTLTKASIPRLQKTMPTALREQWLTLMAKRKVRTVLSSGGVKPVYDGTAKHSLFAKAFIDQLSRNKGVLEGHRLYADIREDVHQSAIALGVDQVPQYAAVKYAGHEVGEFLFVSQ